MTMSKHARHLLAKIGVLIGLIFGALFAASPIMWMFASSLKKNSDIFATPPRFITEHSSLDAYVAIFNDPQKVRFFINSYAVALSVTLLTLLVAILAAFAFSRFTFPGKRILNVSIISSHPGEDRRPDRPDLRRSFCGLTDCVDVRFLPEKEL